MSGITSNVKLLCHFDGADQATALVDNSPSHRAITNAGLKLVVAQYKFGPSALRCDGVNMATVADSPDWQFPGDFTIDTWVRFNSLPPADGGRKGWIGQMQDASNQMFCGLRRANSTTYNWHFLTTLAGANLVELFSSNVLPVINTWYHVAVVRYGNVWSLYVNGAILDTVTSAATYPDYSGVLSIGRSSTSEYVDAWIDELRIINGAAYWTGPFTPETKPYAYEDILSPAGFSAGLLAAAPANITTDLAVSAGVTLGAGFNAGGSYGMALPDQGFTLGVAFSISTNQIDCYIAADIPALDASLYAPYARLAGDIPGLTADITAWAERVAVLKADMQPPVASFVTLVNRTGSLNVALAALSGQIVTLASPTGSFEADIPALQGLFMGIAGVSCAMAGDIPALMGRLDTILDVVGVIPAAMIPALIGSLSVPDSLFEAICLNLKNAGLSTHTNYPFNSLCRFNGRILGASRDGIYEIDAAHTNDNGTPIASQARTGLFDLEAKGRFERKAMLKSVRHAFLGLKSSGDIIFTVVLNDGTTYAYAGDDLVMCETGLRIKIGKGIKSRYIAFDIQNVAGSTFTVDRLRVFAESSVIRKR